MLEGLFALCEFLMSSWPGGAMSLETWMKKLLILIGWLLQRPTGLDLPCFKKDMDFKRVLIRLKMVNYNLLTVYLYTCIFM